MNRIYQAANVKKPDPQDSDEVGDMDWSIWSVFASLLVVIIEE